MFNFVSVLKVKSAACGITTGCSSKVWEPHSDPAERLGSPSFTPDIVNGPHQTPQPTREPYYSTVQGPKYSRPERTAVKSEDFGQVHSADLSIQPVTAVKINPYAEGGGGGGG